MSFILNQNSLCGKRCCSVCVWPSVVLIFGNHGKFRSCMCTNEKVLAIVGSKRNGFFVDAPHTCPAFGFVRPSGLLWFGHSLLEKHTRQKPCGVSNSFKSSRPAVILQIPNQS